MSLDDKLNSLVARRDELAQLMSASDGMEAEVNARVLEKLT